MVCVVYWEHWWNNAGSNRTGRRDGPTLWLRFDAAGVGVDALFISLTHTRPLMFALTLIPALIRNSRHRLDGALIIRSFSHEKNTTRLSHQLLTPTLVCLPSFLHDNCPPPVSVYMR